MKKRILSLLLTACMTLSLLPGTALAAEPLGEPTGLVWGKMLDQGKLVDMPGMVAWEKGAGQHQNEFKVILFQKTGETGKEISNQTWNTDENVTYGHASLFMLLSRDLDDGDYYFTVQAKGDGSTYTDGNVVSSSPWSYVKPAAELHTVTGLSWNWPAATWAATDGEFFSYNVQWFFSPTEDGEYRSYGQTWEIKEPQRTIPDHYILNCGEGFYKFRVRVLSRDITETRNSAWSEYSPAYHLTDLSDAVADALAGITDPDAIRDELQTLDSTSLKSAIMADKDGTKALAQLRRLETMVGGPAGVESTVPELPVSDVSVVGASLNVLKDGVSKPTLTIGQPSVADLALPETLKDCTVSVKFSMDLAGAWIPGELQVPVRITLPVPSTINPDFLRIVHYPADGGTPEILNGVSDFTVTQAGGKNYVTFVLTHFSDFALVDAGSGEGTDPDPDQPDPPTPIAKPITKDMFKVDADEKGVVYTGSAIEPAVTGKDGEKDLTRDTDYTVDYKNNTDVGTATVIVKGKDNYSGELSYTFKITPKPITITGAALKPKTYDGKPDGQVDSVSFDGLVGSQSMVLGTDYTATARFNAAAAGSDKTAKVTVKLLNDNYSLEKTEYELTGQTIAKAPLALSVGPIVMKSEADYTRSVVLSATADLPTGESFTYTVETTPQGVNAELAEDGKTLTLKAVAGGSVSSESITCKAVSDNYEGTITLAIEYTDKTPVVLSGITVADKTYDGKKVEAAGTLTVATADNKPVTVAETSVTRQWFAAADKSAALAEAPADAGEYVLKITVDTSKTVVEGGGGGGGSTGGDVTGGGSGGTDPETPPTTGGTDPVDPPTTGGGGEGEPTTQADEATGEKFYGVLEIPFTISKATVTVKADDKSIKVNGTLPTFTYTVTGLVDKDKDDPWQTTPNATCAGGPLDKKGTYEIQVTAGALKPEIAGNYEVKTVNGTFKVTSGGSNSGYIPNYGSGGSSDSSSTTKPTETKPAETTVSVPTASNGKVALDNEKAKKGDTVTITVTPDRGYKLGKLTLTDKNGKEIALTDAGDGKFTFTMPDSQVEVKAEFEKDAANPAQPITERFNDIKDSNWYRDAVQYVYDKGMMNGVTPKNFEPALSTSRAMLVTILYRLESEPQVGPAGFADVAGDMYYASPVAWAAEKGLVTGHEDGTFRPDQELTREQLVAILYRYAKLKGYSTAKGEKNTAFTDGAVIEPYAREAVEWAASIGLVNGYQDGSFRPAGSAARAELAAILMRFCQNVAKLDG